MQQPKTPLLNTISAPADLKKFNIRQLRLLADELRSETLWAVSQTGGHLGASLGVVELTIAIHAIFDTPKDRLIWDVSHQSYPHKILTGRRERMASLRSKGGLSGFTSRRESIYDPFGAAHSSTSISAALGFAVARACGAVTSPPLGDAIAVIGDGALSAGMAYEAMNNAGHWGKRLIVILNDNKMSIAPPVGAMATYLTKLYAGRPFQEFKFAAKSAISFLPEPLQDGAKRARGLLKYITIGGTLFEQLGFSYIGPIDGHDMQQLVDILTVVKTRATTPILVHVITQKGKGYPPAENAADKYHGVAKFDIISGKQHKNYSNAPSYTSVFADTLIKQARIDDKITAVTAAMPDGTGLDRFARHFPARCFDVGIAEQHAVTFCAGMAAAGLKPFCALYSTFLQRGYDQVVHDVALQCLPVRFAIDRAGLVGADGATHAGSFDIAYLCNIPNFIVMAAADEAELMHMVATACSINTQPCAFRFPRGAGIGIDLPLKPKILPIGKARIIQNGARIALISFGARLQECLKAAEKLKLHGLNPTIVDARFAKPFDQALILQLADSHEAIITIEEGVIGGFGTHVMQFLAEKKRLENGLKMRSMVLPDLFINHDKPSGMYEKAGLNAWHIKEKVLDVLNMPDIEGKHLTF